MPDLSLRGPTLHLQRFCSARRSCDRGSAPHQGKEKRKAREMNFLAFFFLEERRCAPFEVDGKCTLVVAISYRILWYHLLSLQQVRRSTSAAPQYKEASISSESSTQNSSKDPTPTRTALAHAAAPVATTSGQRNRHVPGSAKHTSQPSLVCEEELPDDTEEGAAEVKPKPKPSKATMAARTVCGI